MATLTPIKDLQPQLNNVTIEGVIQNKSALSPMKRKGDWYFFYLQDGKGESIRVAAFGEPATDTFQKITNGDTVRLTKMNIQENVYNSQRRLQAVMSKGSEVIIATKALQIQTKYTNIKDLSGKEDIVNVRGLVLNVRADTRMISSTNAIKDVCIVSIKDETGSIDVTFWDHLQFA
ncbi:unnamed protein product, partial [Brugia timori]|uniref:OB domain-containing protein n=1 Tax=Brugia timori TaxID=42155 RepID=A0A0R3QDP3_9BILA